MQQAAYDVDAAVTQLAPGVVGFIVRDCTLVDGFLVPTKNE